MDNEDAMLVELKKISGFLEPKPTPPPPKGFIQEFKEFLVKYKIVGLAAAFILAIYLGLLIKAFVDDLVMPIIQYIIPGLNSVGDWKAGHFLIGDFVAAGITFIIIAFVIFLLVKVTMRYHLE